jgi:triosephosphate isomerase
MTRRALIAANWKMNKSRDDARAFVAALLPMIADTPPQTEVVIAPPFTALDAISGPLLASDVALAGQNVCAEAEGAFTGEISAAMLVDLGCRYGIVGHSERRALFGESSDEVGRKADALLRAGMGPIVCVGETQAQREVGSTTDIVAEQLAAGLPDSPPDRAGRVVVAYEPVWAIGTGLTATPEQAQEVHAFIRERLRERYAAGAEQIRILYGGSVKPDNVAAIMAQPDIDGALVGGASLDAQSFSMIVQYDRQENVSS